MTYSHQENKKAEKKRKQISDPGTCSFSPLQCSLARGCSGEGFRASSGGLHRPSVGRFEAKAWPPSSRESCPLLIRATSVRGELRNEGVATFFEKTVI